MFPEERTNESEAKKQNLRDSQHWRFSLNELAAKIAFDNLLRNEASPRLPLATSEYGNISWIHHCQVPPDLSVQP